MGATLSGCRTIPISAAGDYQRLLAGPPESLALRAGMVTLAPGASVGKHNTEGYEELIVVLGGSGVLLQEEGGETLLDVRHFCYCPPHAGHDVRNTGTEPLRYVYVVAKTE